MAELPMFVRKLAVVYALALLVALATGIWSYVGWQNLRESGASRMLATSHTKRYVTNPGIEAWLVNLLERAGERLSARDQVVFEGLMREKRGDIAELSPCMAHYAAQLLAAPQSVSSERPRVSDAPPPPSVAVERDPMRSVQHVELGGHTLVLTRRRSLSEREATLVPEIEQAAAQLVALANTWKHGEPPDWLTDRTLVQSPPQLVRFFAVVEDGSVLTLPISNAGGVSLDDETAKLWRRLREPSVASIVVFDPHDFSLPREQNIHYTGLYPDKLGHGFVATLAVPGVHEPGRLKVLIAVDLALSISHDRLVAAADPSVQLAAVELPSEVRGLWQPWVTLLSVLPPDAPADMLEEIHEQALRQTQHEEWAQWEPLVFEKTDRGVLFATALTKDHWLVGLARDPPLPWVSMLLAPGLMLVLLALVALLLEGQLQKARVDERNKLATILDHGVDMLARVLAAQLHHDKPDEQDEHELALRRWLADYLFARVLITQWILERWGGPPCREIECILGPEHLQTVVDKYQEIFVRVRRDARLRAQLHWNNGTLAAAPSDANIIDARIDWPDEYRLTAPVEGLFGYFIGEVLVNAIKHGAPGHPITIEVDLDRARRELDVRVRNARVPEAADSRVRQTYGGSAILDEIARVCGWKLSRTRTDDAFEVRWTCPVTLQRAAKMAD